MNQQIKKRLIGKRRYVLINLLFKKEKRFLTLILFAFLLAGFSYPYPSLAMWVGFGLAAYSSVANDSIQTLGTFIAASSDKKWWILWIFIGLTFVVVVSISWVMYEGDVSYQRLASKGFAQAPQSFHFLQIAAPIFLLILTRMKMPVSTTFLLLSSFTTNSGAIVAVLQKSVIGYVIAFSVAFLIWILADRFLKPKVHGKHQSTWTIIQWITTGFLWSLWIIQDAANIAVFLPRKLDVVQFIFFALTIFLGLGLIFKLKGDKIQEVVNEKTDIRSIQSATIIDMVYVLILVLFTWVNTVPMSTTWVFIGLLGGRELGIKARETRSLYRTWTLIRNDLTRAIIGLAISIIVAIAANEHLKSALVSQFNWEF